jgi:AcrR family transcriptional regulator
MDVPGAAAEGGAVPAPAAPRRPRPDRRSALAEAAFRRLAAGGFEGLRTRDVAADAGVNIATLHYYFPTKEALVRSVIGRAVQRFQATLPREGSPVAQLRGHLRALALLLEEDPQLWAVMGELGLRAPRDADLAHTLRQTDAFWRRTLRDLIDRARAAGDLDPGLDAEEAATLLIAAVKGLSLPTVAGFRPESIDQVFRQLERLLGLPPPEP